MVAAAEVLYTIIIIERLGKTAIDLLVWKTEHKSVLFIIIALDGQVATLEKHRDRVTDTLCRGIETLKVSLIVFQFGYGNLFHFQQVDERRWRAR